MSFAAAGAPPWQMGSNNFPPPPHSNAYIPVPARQSFSNHSALSPPPSYVPSPLHSNAHTVPPPPPTTSPGSTMATNGEHPRKKVEWPPGTRDYVQRSFAVDNQISGVQKPEIEARLKQVITEITQGQRLYSTDWKTLPLPQQMILQERSLSGPSPPVPMPGWRPPPTMLAAPRILEPLEHNLKKRKSNEMSSESDNTVSTPPWRSKKPIALEDRISYVPASEKRPKFEANVSKSQASLDHRKKRFDDARAGSFSPQTPTFSRASSPPPSQATGPVAGRCQKLEKNYFRLTSAPNPDDVRPLEVLRQTLELLKKKWRTDANYTYICDQFKSLRQDLTVQHIKNDFTTNVYEIHARIALEKGDLGEYNQCQTQLRALYQQNLGGHPVEFKAYRILYFIHTCNRTDMNDVLSDLTPTDKKEAAIKHALEVRSALALGNYHKFFKLYLEVPHMGAYLMDMFVARERLVALASICKSYKADVILRFITEELAFESDEECAAFILEYASKELFSDRQDNVTLLTGKAGSLFESAKAAAFKQVDIKGQI